MEKAIHSDFLIHWSGKDIEKSPDNKDDQYLERLRSILKYGLWMTEDESPEVLNINDNLFTKPLTPRTCFSELKLSESDEHAKEYGRLGIGVKRYFLFDRLGSPLFYIQEGTKNLFFPPFQSANGHVHDFFKHMCIKTPKDYKYYNESEWRIVYSEEIKEELIKNNLNEINNLFDSPFDQEEKERFEFFSGLKPKKAPSYLMPLDPWLAIIIYPNLNVKNKALTDKEIRGLLDVISQRKTRTGCPERGCKPIELDLAACRNF